MRRSIQAIPAKMVPCPVVGSETGSVLQKYASYSHCKKFRGLYTKQSHPNWWRICKLLQHSWVMTIMSFLLVEIRLPFEPMLNEPLAHTKNTVSSLSKVTSAHWRKTHVVNNRNACSEDAPADMMKGYRYVKVFRDCKGFTITQTKIQLTTCPQLACQVVAEWIYNYEMSDNLYW